MNRAVFPIAVAGVFLALPFAASQAVGQTDCQAVVQATVAELAAGYPDWNPSMEALARTAAGSACVKVGAAAVEPELRSQPVAAAVAAESGQGEAENEAANSEAAGPEASKEGGYNPFSELKFNDVSASPSKKPYERRRD